MAPGVAGRTSCITHHQCVAGHLFVPSRGISSDTAGSEGAAGVFLPFLYYIEAVRIGVGEQFPGADFHTLYSGTFDVFLKPVCNDG